MPQSLPTQLWHTHWWLVCHLRPVAMQGLQDMTAAMAYMDGTQPLPSGKGNKGRGKGNKGRGKAPDPNQQLPVGGSNPADGNQQDANNSQRGKPKAKPLKNQVASKIQVVSAKLTDVKCWQSKVQASVLQFVCFSIHCFLGIWCVAVTTCIGTTLWVFISEN